MKVKILFVIGGLMRGGKERQLIEILKYFSTNPQFTTGLLVFSKDQHSTETAKKIVNKFYCITKRPTRLEPFFKVNKVFRDFKPDIVHTWDSLSSLYSYLPLKKYRAKFVDGSIRDSGVRKGWQYFIAKFFFNKADLVIGNTKAGLKYYDVNGEVLYNAIDAKRFKLKNDNGEFNIINTSNFSSYKDHDTFFRAALRLLGDGIVDNVYLAGDGKNKQKYIKHIIVKYPELSKRVHFLGNVENVETYLAKCKVGVLCSTVRYKEGLSNSVLEYMASGLAAIVTNVGGNPEIIAEGINGYLVDEGDSDKIYDLVHLLKEDSVLLEKIVRNAIQTIESKFSYSANVEHLVELYKSHL